VVSFTAGDPLQQTLIDEIYLRALLNSYLLWLKLIEGATKNEKVRGFLTKLKELTGDVIEQTSKDKDSPNDRQSLLKRTGEGLKNASRCGGDKAKIQDLQKQFSQLTSEKASNDYLKVVKNIDEAIDIYKSVIALPLRLNEISLQTTRSVCYEEIVGFLKIRIDILKRIEEEGEFSKNEQKYLDEVKSCRNTLTAAQKAIRGAGNKKVEFDKFSGAIKSFNSLVEKLSNRMNPSSKWAELLRSLKKIDVDPRKIFDAISEVGAPPAPKKGKVAAVKK
jgi:hypothetical protein